MSTNVFEKVKEKFAKILLVFNKYGIYHGDLKLDNVMVIFKFKSVPDGLPTIDVDHLQLKIIDFGQVIANLVLSSTFHA